jgi:hypothetical protein
MRHLAVEPGADEMAQLVEAARARHIDPTKLTKSQLLKLLLAQSPLAPVDTTRAKRLAAIMSVHGVWKDDPGKPQDAVAYQREARAEWR